MPTWPEYVTDILANDVCVALAYRTPAGGVVLTPVTTFGTFDAQAGTVTTTTSFGTWKKLVRIAADDRVALVYHARDHSDVEHPHLVVAQGHASFPDTPDGSWLTAEALARVDRFVPVPKPGRVWDWIGREYYQERVAVTIAVRRLVVFDDDDAAGPSEVIGDPLAAEPPPQDPPAKGTAPRVRAKRYASRVRKSPHQLAGYAGGDGFPMAHRVSLSQDGETLRFTSPALPPGGRRAGVLAHWFGAQMLGQGTAVMTGWLDVDGGQASYSPHTVAGYVIPASRLVLAVGGGFNAKFGYRKAVKDGHVKDRAWQTRP
jgi:hypothetical protein